MTGATIALNHYTQESPLVTRLGSIKSIITSIFRESTQPIRYSNKAEADVFDDLMKSKKFAEYARELKKERSAKPENFVNLADSLGLKRK